MTPTEDIETFLKEFQKVEPLDWTSLKILDPAAGGNNEVRDEMGLRELRHEMSYPTALTNLYGECNIDTYDIREDSFAVHKENYLQAELNYEPDIIITNPPFSIAMDVVNKALRDVKQGGFVIMLLRLNFFGSKERFKFFKEHMPKYVFVHHKRMSFFEKKKEGVILFDKTGNPRRGATDSIEYCHMVFQKGNYSEFAKLKVI